MSTTSVTQTFLDSTRKVIKFAWASMANGDTGESVEFSLYKNRSVQVNGTFGAGGSVLLEGSNNDEVSYATLKDAAVAPVVFGSAGIKTVIDLAERARPRVTAGDGTTSLTVTLLCWNG